MENNEYIKISQIFKIINQQKEFLTIDRCSKRKLTYEEVFNILDNILFECKDSKDTKNNYETKKFEKRKCQSKNEITVENAIKKLGYTPYHNVIKNDCIGKYRPLPFDFGILVNGKELLIEFDGEQHEKPIKYFGGIKKAQEIKLYDQIKNDYCEKNNIPLLRLNAKSRIYNDIHEFIKMNS